MASTEHTTRTDEARLVRRFRRLDVLAGIPLTWLATRLRRLGAAAVPAPRPPRTVVLIKLSENGSVVLLAPVLQRIAERWPDARVVFLTFEENREVLGLVPGAEAATVLAIDPSRPGAFLRSTLAALRSIRSVGADTAIDLEHFSRFSALLAYASGATTRVGFHRFELEGLYRGDLFTHRVSYNPYLHTSRAFLGLVDAVEADPGELPMVKQPVPEGLPRLPAFRARPGDAEALDAKLEEALRRPVGEQRIFVLNPNASERIPIRKWPLERYVELGRRLLDSPRHLLVLIGKGEDRHDTHAIHDALGSARCVDLSGRTDLGELLALFERATALVTNDSGPAHFAALTRTPTVVLFGPESPTLYAPLGDRHRALYASLQCSPCVSAYNHRQTPCERARCLEAIGVDEVLSALADLGVAQRALRRVG